MKHLFTFSLCFLCFVQIQAQNFKNTNVGIAFTYPDSWEEGKSEEAPPFIIFNAKNKKNSEEMFMLMAIPSADYAPAKEHLKNWVGRFITSMKGMSESSLKKSEVKTYPSGAWYYVVFPINDQYNMHMLSSTRNGFSYSLLMNVHTKDTKAFEKSLSTMMKSLKFSKPEFVSKTAAAFQQLELAENTQLQTPQDFEWKDNIDENPLPPFVSDVYGFQLSKKAADFALFTDGFMSQLFALNIKFDDLLLGEDACNMISKVAINQWESNNSMKYEELHLGAWKQLPEKVYLHKFRLLKKYESTTHYIFFCQKDGKTLHLRFQTPTQIEKDFEASIENLVLKNFK